MESGPRCRGGPAPAAALLLGAHLRLLRRERGILKGTTGTGYPQMLMLLGCDQLLVKLMLADYAGRGMLGLLLGLGGRNVVVLKVVLGRMGLTGGHHPERRAPASHHPRPLRLRPPRRSSSGSYSRFAVATGARPSPLTFRFPAVRSSADFTPRRITPSDRRWFYFCCCCYPDTTPGLT